MSYKKNNSAAILVAISVIALAFVSTSGFNHSYTAFAAPNKDRSSSSSSTGGYTNGIITLGGSSSAATTANPNSNALTKKELSSLISCINTANRSQGLTHKVVTNCLDTARGITSASSTTARAATSSPSSVAPQSS